MSVTWQVGTQLTEVETSWRTALAASHQHNFFLEPQIQHAWWSSHDQPPLQVLVVQQDQQPVGVLPLCRVGQQLQFLGDQTVTDYADAVIVPGHQAAVATALQQYLAADHNWQRVQLISLPANSSLRPTLPAVAAALGATCSETASEVCPVITLPASWPDYLTMVGKKQRHEIKRKWQRLSEQQPLSFRVVTDLIAHPEALAAFYRLHQLSSPEKAAFWTPTQRRFFDQLSLAASQGGWLRLYFLDVAGRPAAAMYTFAYAQQLLIYNSGFDPVTYAGLSVGNVLTAYTIQDAIAQGFQRYDFLRGNEEYKLRYRAVPEPIFTVELRR